MAPSATYPLSPRGTKSGIKTTKEGESFIPASVRLDGTVRKEIRVKPGYKPPEDVEVYKNRTAESWKNRGKPGVPGAEAVEQKKEAVPANKNAKRREARKKATENVKDEADEDEGVKLRKKIGDWNDLASQKGKGERITGENGGSKKEEVLDPEAEKAKEARKLSKKLRQARELKEKKEKGDSLLPEQFEKVIKIMELIRQLDNLGFDQDGDKNDAAVRTQD